MNDKHGQELNLTALRAEKRILMHDFFTTFLILYG